MVAWAKFIDANSIVVFDCIMYLCAIAAAGIEHEPLINGGGPASVEVCDLGCVTTAIGTKKPQKLYCHCPKFPSNDRTDAQRGDA